MRRVLIVVALVSLSACGGSTPTAPTPPAPSYPTITGTYITTTTYTVAGLRPLTCPGTITVADQTGPVFSGRYTMDDAGPCASFRGTVQQGTLQPNGALAFTLNPGLGIQECTITGGDAMYAGTVTAATLDVRRNVTVTCADVGATGMTVRIEGTK